jgi:hypothetical protein
MVVNNLHLKRFRKDGFTLYIYGVCSSCQARMTRRKNQERRKEQERLREQEKLKNLEIQKKQDRPKDKERIKNKKTV